VQRDKNKNKYDIGTVQNVTDILLWHNPTSTQKSNDSKPGESSKILRVFNILNQMCSIQEPVLPKIPLMGQILRLHRHYHHSNLWSFLNERLEFLHWKSSDEKDQ
jgi:hypothetical protein